MRPIKAASFSGRQGLGLPGLAFEKSVTTRYEGLSTHRFHSGNPIAEGVCGASRPFT